MMEIANSYANSEEDDRLRSGKSRVGGDNNQSGQNRNNNNNNNKNKRKADKIDGVELIALANQFKGKGQKKEWNPRKKPT